MVHEENDPYNHNQCLGVGFVTATWGDAAQYDPNGLIFAENQAGWESGTLPEDESDLKGVDLGIALCRADYD